MGWVLSLVGASYKSRKERKGLIGNLLTKLIRVERQIQILLFSTEQIKDLADSWEKYEPLRQSISNRHFLEPACVRDDLKSAIDDLAPQYPIQALELEDLYHTLLKNKSANLTASSVSLKAYVQMLSVYEVGMEFVLKGLVKSINKLALRHSMATYIQVLYARHRRFQNRKKSEPSATTLLDSIKQEILNHKNMEPTVKTPVE